MLFGLFIFAILALCFAISYFIPTKNYQHQYQDPFVFLMNRNFEHHINNMKTGLYDKTNHYDPASYKDNNLKNKV